MSAECNKCGHDLDYNLNCAVCDWRRKAEAAESALAASRDREGRLEAKNGEPCDCETPGDWHRVANDFQRAMFEERRQAGFAVIERDALEGAIEAALRTLDTMGLEGGEVCRGLRAALSDPAEDGDVTVEASR
jgi:hypothetical protein